MIFLIIFCGITSQLRFKSSNGGKYNNHGSLVAMYQWLEGMFCLTLLLWSVSW